MPTSTARNRAANARASLTMSGRESHRGIFGSEPTGSVGQSQLRPGEPRRRSYHKLASELNDEGILYTVKVSQSHTQKMTKWRRFLYKLRGKKKNGVGDDGDQRNGADNHLSQPQDNDGEGRHESATLSEINLSSTLNLTSDPEVRQQFKIEKIKTRGDYWGMGLLRSFGIEVGSEDNVDSHSYRPDRFIRMYLYWAFQSTFGVVFLSFLAIFVVICMFFAALYLAAGTMTPECIIVSSQEFGANPMSMYSDAFALSWTTFTTVGYGNTYTATGNDFDSDDAAHRCSGVILLCTVEAFLGLLFASMCGAILFGKVARVQSHAHLTFANAICLQCEKNEEDFVDDCSTDSDVDEELDVFTPRDGRQTRKTIMLHRMSTLGGGCPSLKIQAVNDLCNRGGGEMIDAVMKVVGVRMQMKGGKISYVQYVKVDLVDEVNPFFARVWHGNHVLDQSSPLLTANARKAIERNGGAWPTSWFKSPEKMRRKLDFHSLIVTVSGISNLSASSVHAYKRYKSSDVIIGFDFAPLVYEKPCGALAVDMGLINDVCETRGGRGEHLLGETSLEETDQSVITKERGVGASLPRFTSTVIRRSTGQQ